MKAQFKYAFMAGGFARVFVSAVIFAMNLVFIVLGSLGLLPVAALITAVSLGGVGIGVMAVVNVIGDIAIIHRLFAAPRAYLHALTPVPRWKTLLASVLSVVVSDIASMAVAISGVVWTSLILAGSYVGDAIRNTVLVGASDIMLGFWFSALAFAGYLLVLMVIIFCITINKSLFYQKRGGGMLTALVAVGLAYVINVSPIVLAPFGAVSRWGLHFTVSLGGFGLIMYVLLLLAQSAALFIFSSKLMERKLNI